MIASATSLLALVCEERRLLIAIPQPASVLRLILPRPRYMVMAPASGRPRLKLPGGLLFAFVAFDGPTIDRTAY